MREADFHKYLRKNPAPALDLPPETTAAAVIPVYDELAELPATVDSLLAAIRASYSKIALIFVVNEPAGADDSSSLAAVDMLNSLSGKHPEIHTIYTPQLTGGVGQARKLGMDAICHCIKFENLNKFALCSLDADTLVDGEYFNIVPAAVCRAPGALTIGFRHRQSSDPEVERAIRLYENYLDRYVSRLRNAGSPYAFHTIGSAFAVRLDSYVAAGGMRVRQAGEDFYFLQAAAKSAQVRILDRILVHPSPRISARVPFGTGPAVGRIIAGESLPEIPDAAFDALKSILNAAAESPLKNPHQLLEKMAPAGREFFTSEGFQETWQKIVKNLPDNEKTRLKAFHEWFDALKTLRFLHFFEKKLIT